MLIFACLFHLYTFMFSSFQTISTLEKAVFHSYNFPYRKYNGLVMQLGISKEFQKV